MSAENLAQEALQAAISAADELWEEPVPIVRETEIAPYPLHALPDPIRHAVEEVVEFAQFPVALAASCALAVVSLVCQALGNVKRDDHLTGPISLFFLTVAESGERKTTADNFFSTAIYDHDRKQRKDHEDTVAVYNADLANFEASKQGLKQKIAIAKKKGTTDLDTIVDLQQLERDAPVRPKYPQLIYNDATPEALGLSLYNVWPSGGVMSSEAGLVLGGHGMSPDSVMHNLALLNTLWDGKPFKVDRAHAPSYVLEAARLTIGLAVQMLTLQAFFERSKGLARGTGFAARFLIAAPDSTQGTRFYKPPASGMPNLSSFHKQVSAMLAHYPKLDDDTGHLSPPMLTLADDAKREWIECHDDIEAELGPSGSMVETRDVASKAADNVARLAALFHIFSGESPDTPISAEHVRSSATIVSWHLYEARRLLGQVSMPAHQQKAAMLDAWLISYCLKHGVSTVLKRDIQQLGPSATRKKSDLEPVLDELAELNHIRYRLAPHPNLVHVNPALIQGQHGAA